jgi:hypothetical protein
MKLQRGYVLWINWWITNKFRDRLEKQHVNDHVRVQIRSEWREFNVRAAIKRVNTNMDEFVVDNVDMNDVDFEDVFVGYGENFR